MKTLALQQVSSEFARRNSAKTLEKAIGLKYIRGHLSELLRTSLEASCPDGSIHVWGAKSERLPQTSRMQPRETLFLFRRGKRIFKYGVMIQKDDNPALAENFWGRDTDGELWSTIFFFRRLKDRGLSAAHVNELLGRKEQYHWQGLVALYINESEKNDEFFRQELEGL